MEVILPRWVIIALTLALQVVYSVGSAPPEVWLAEYIPTSTYQNIMAVNMSINYAPIEKLASIATEEVFRYQKTGVVGSISKNEGEYVVTDRKVQSVAFICQAKYPIKWTFPNLQHFSHLNSKSIQVRYFRTATLNPSNSEPENRIFRSYLKFQPETPAIDRITFLSVSITCEAASNSKDSNTESKSNVYLYWQKKFGLEYQGTTVPVIVPENNNEDVILPCRPGLPNATVVLDKKNPQGAEASSWETQTLSDTLKFDPKVGFIFSKKSAEEVQGLYRCKLEPSGEATSHQVEFLFLNVNVSQGASLPPFENKWTLPEKASFKIEKEFGGLATVTCCSGDTSKPASAHAQSCGSFEECDVLKSQFPRIFWAKQRNLIHIQNTKALQRPRTNKALIPRANKPSMPGDCSAVHVEDRGGIITACQGGGVDIQEEYMSFMNHESRKETIVNMTVVQTEFKKLTHFETFKKLESAKSEDKIHIGVGIPNNAVRGNFFPHRSIYTKAFLPRGTNRLTPHSYAEIPSPIYDGELISLMCFYPKLLFANPGHLQVNWKNGTKTTVELEHDDVYVTFDMVYIFLWKSPLLQSSRGQAGQTSHAELIATFSKPLKADSEMESVDCYAPVWNSPSWEKRTLPLKITASSAPKFTGAEEETLTFDTTQETHEIACELGEGMPGLNRIEFFKDGMSIKNWMGVNQSSTYDTGIEGSKGVNRESLTFTKLSDEMEGLYECRAENPKGVAVKKIKVEFKK